MVGDLVLGLGKMGDVARHARFNSLIFDLGNIARCVPFSMSWSWVNLDSLCPMQLVNLDFNFLCCMVLRQVILNLDVFSFQICNFVPQ